MFTRFDFHEKWLAAGSSPVDWCEENYTVSPYIAEYTNTITNLVPILMGSLCLIAKLWSSYLEHVSAVPCALILIHIFIGLSSAYFHAHLSLLGQFLDEILILYSFCLIYLSLLPNRYKPTFLSAVQDRIAWTIVAILFTIVWFMFPSLYAFGLVLMPIPSLIIDYKELTVYKTLSNPLIAKVMIGSYIFVVSLWVADRALCTVWLGLGIPGLHNIFHTLASPTSYLTMTIFAYWKAEADYPHVTPSIRYTRLGVPYVYCKVKTSC